MKLVAVSLNVLRAKVRKRSNRAKREAAYAEEAKRLGITVWKLRVMKAREVQQIVANLEEERRQEARLRAEHEARFSPRY